MLNPRLSATELEVHRKRTPVPVEVALNDVRVSSLSWEFAGRACDPAELVAGLAGDAIANAQLERTTAKETDEASRRRARPKRVEQHIFAR